MREPRSHRLRDQKKSLCTQILQLFLMPASLRLAGWPTLVLGAPGSPEQRAPPLGEACDLGPRGPALPVLSSLERGPEEGCGAEGESTLKFFRD